MKNQKLDCWWKEIFNQKQDSWKHIFKVLFWSYPKQDCLIWRNQKKIVERTVLIKSFKSYLKNDRWKDILNEHYKLSLICGKSNKDSSKSMQSIEVLFEHEVLKSVCWSNPKSDRWKDYVNEHHQS